jgi:hypothetical protein
LLGGAAWGLALLALLLVWLLGGLRGPADASLGLMLFLVVLLLLAGLSGLFGVGLAAAQLRRKDQPSAVLAALGLFLGGSYVGVLLGLFTLCVWSY